MNILQRSRGHQRSSCQETEASEVTNVEVADMGVLEANTEYHEIIVLREEEIYKQKFCENIWRRRGICLMHESKNSAKTIWRRRGICLMHESKNSVKTFEDDEVFV